MENHLWLPQNDSNWVLSMAVTTRVPQIQSVHSFVGVIANSRNTEGHGAVSRVSSLFEVCQQVLSPACCPSDVTNPSVKDIALIPAIILTQEGGEEGGILTLKAIFAL